MSDTQSNFATLYKLARWMVLIVLVFVIIVALKKPMPPALPQDPQQARQNAESFTEKLDQLETARSRGESSEARFSSDEVNATISESISQSAPHPPEVAQSGPAPVVEPSKPVAPPSAESDAPGPIRTVQVAFLGDQVIGQFATEVYGKEMYVTLAGKLGSKDGYVTFQPSAFRVGDLSVPISLVNGQLQTKLSAPENREKLKLPDFVSELRIEDGQLVIVEK
jgi:uncharacterized protein YpmS